MVIQSIPIGMLVFDEHKELLFTNTYAEAMFGVVQEEIKGKKCGDFINCVHRFEDPQECGETEECSGCLLNRALERVLDEGTHSYSDRGVAAVRLAEIIEPSYLSFRVNAIILDGRRCALMSLYDVTEQKQAEKRMRKFAEEKAQLMNEMNHRIKNNLSLVSSLINLKQEELGGQTDLSDLRNQIETIGLLHERLYDSEDNRVVDLKEYFDELLQSIFSFSLRGDVHYEARIAVTSLPTKTVVSCGLILNELATNAIKYGFKDGKEAYFEVELTREASGSGYILKVSNSGKPFPEGVFFDSPKTLGLRLISALVDQLNGSIELQRSPSPVFTIRFPSDS